MQPPRWTAAIDIVGHACAAALLALAPASARTAECTPLALPPYDADAASGGWAHVPLSRLKHDTVYSVIERDGERVLQAVAQDSASAFVHMQRIDVANRPVLTWRWRTDALIAEADNTDARREDSPLRVIVGFDGDRSTLPEEEQRRFALARRVSGRDLPFAMLIYIWENRRPVDSVIPSEHTGRVKMIVVDSGPQGTGAWRSYRRNLVDDYVRAFGEKPGPVIGIALMTDTDNTGATATGLYGPIALACPDR